MPQQAVGMGGTFIIMERQNVSWNIEALYIYRTKFKRENGKKNLGTLFNPTFYTEAALRSLC